MISQMRSQSLAEDAKMRYTDKWRDPSYRLRSPAVDAWEDIKREFCKLNPNPAESPDTRVIDVGTGTGRVLPLIRDLGFQPLGLDCAENCMDEDIAKNFTLWTGDILDLLQESCSIILCSDVLEHIPEERVKEVLEALAACGDIGVVIGVSLLPDNGKLHCTVRPEEMWIEDCKEHWAKVTKCKVSCNLPRQNSETWLLLRCEH